MKKAAAAKHFDLEGFVGQFAEEAGHIEEAKKWKVAGKANRVKEVGSRGDSRSNSRSRKENRSRTDAKGRPIRGDSEARRSRSRRSASKGREKK